MEMIIFNDEITLILTWGCFSAPSVLQLSFKIASEVGFSKRDMAVVETLSTQS